MFCDHWHSKEHIHYLTGYEGEDCDAYSIKVRHVICVKCFFVKRYSFIRVVYIIMTEDNKLVDVCNRKEDAIEKAKFVSGEWKEAEVTGGLDN